MHVTNAVPVREAGSDLDGLKIVVTGASSGIGESVARLCTARGANVAGIARRSDRLRHLQDEFGLFPVAADVANPVAARTAVDDAAEALGGIDAVINNAGVYLLGGVDDGQYEDWHRMFAVNVLAVLSVTQAALPHLKKSVRPHVVNIGSVGGRRVARPSTAIYSATKFALNAVTEGMRQELHPLGIRVTVVSPGTVKTEIGAGSSDAVLLHDMQERQTQVGIEAAHVASAVAFVLSNPSEVTVHEVVILPTAQGL